MLTVREARETKRRDAVLVTTPQRIGSRAVGERHWLVCPECESKRSWLLVLDDGGLSCRACCGIPYRSQHLSRRTRLRSRAYGLIARLGGEDDAGVVWKPPRMRWATYTRLWARIDALQTAGGWSYHPPRADPRFGTRRCHPRRGIDTHHAVAGSGDRLTPREPT